MKNRLFINLGNLITATAVFWTGIAISAPSAKTAAAAPPALKAKPVPQSVYVEPTKDKEGGRDPFYPNSNRGQKVIQIVTPTAQAITLKLSGISQGFAMINGRTMAPGEESDIKTPTARVHVRLVEIREKDSAVVVEVDGTRRELTLTY